MKKKNEEAAAIWVDIETLTPWEDNPRKNKHAVDSVAKSIERFGFAAPIVARKQDGQIIAGHTRLQAAKRLKLEKVPVRFLNISVEEAARLAVADNKLVELADWDDALLMQFIQESPDEDWTDFGFTDKEIQKILGEIETEIDDEDMADQLQFRVLITLDTESAQFKCIEMLEKEGYQCQPLIS